MFGSRGGGGGGGGNGTGDPAYMALPTKSGESAGAEDAAADGLLPNFREILPAWAYPEEAAALADELAEEPLPEDRMLPMRCCAGPAVPWARRSALFIGVVQVLLFAAALRLTTCNVQDGIPQYPLWIWAVYLPVVVLNICVEVRCLSYSIIPFVQATGSLRIPIWGATSYPVWLAFRLSLSVLNLVDPTADTLFAVTSLRMGECTEHRFDRIWDEMVAQSPFAALAPSGGIGLGSLALVSWVLIQAQLLYPMAESLPRCGEPSSYVVTKEGATDFVNLVGEKVTVGDALHTISEASCMSSVSIQGLQYPQAREQFLRRSLPPGKALVAKRHLFFVRNALVRGIIRIALVGLLENSVQIGLQTNFFALSMAVDFRLSTATLQQLVSIALSIVMSCMKIAEGFGFLAFSEDVQRAVLEEQPPATAGAARDVAGTAAAACGAAAPELDDEAMRELRTVRRLSCTLRCFVAAGALSLAWAACTLAAVFVCEDSLLSLSTGCLHLDDPLIERRAG